jgi:hypothetical protein
MNLTSYRKYILKISHGNRTVLFGIIQRDYNNHYPVTLELLAETRDKEYTVETFAKATDILLNEIKK